MIQHRSCKKSTSNRRMSHTLPNSATIFNLHCRLTTNQSILSHLSTVVLWRSISRSWLRSWKNKMTINSYSSSHTKRSSSSHLSLFCSLSRIQGLKILNTNNIWLLQSSHYAQSMRWSSITSELLLKSLSVVNNSNQQRRLSSSKRLCLASSLRASAVKRQSWCKNTQM